MQVFVPYTNLTLCVKALDDKRLRKQALECSQLIDIILDIPTKSGKERSGWKNHPAYLAWKDNAGALIQYMTYCVAEIKERGFKTDYCDEKLQEYKQYTTSLNSPVWWGDEEIHSSHRARLLQKGYEEKLKYGNKADKIIAWYSYYNWKEMKDPHLFYKEYIWPTEISKSGYNKEIRTSKDNVKTKEVLIKTFGSNPYM